jgi:CheY-like chemotaxis protein
VVQPQTPPYNVLVVGEELTARNVVRILLGSEGCRCTIVSNLQEGLTLIAHKNFDAIVFDAQNPRVQAEQLIRQLGEIHSHLLQRIVVITDEGNDSEVQNLIARYSFVPVQRKGLVQQLWAGVESLMRAPAAVSRLSQKARLIFDTFQDALCAGVRNAPVRSRHLLYAAGTLQVDLWIEPRAGSDHVTVTGQILDTALPDRRYSSVPIALQGCDGVVANTTSNEFGEFHLDFDFEPGVSLDIKMNPTSLVTLSLPKNSSGMTA